MGLAMISMGDNQKMVTTLGINGSAMKLIGVSMANGLVALSGGLAAMYLGFGDINLGQGIIISGLASVMIGEFIVRRNTMFFLTLRVIIGCTIYKAAMYVGRIYGEPNDLKLWTGLLVIACLAFTKFPILKKKPKSLGGV
jgi:putative ABC transport system permease protein